MPTQSRDGQLFTSPRALPSAAGRRHGAGQPEMGSGLSRGGDQSGVPVWFSHQVLLDMVARSALEDLELRHAVACVSPDGAVLTVTGPYHDEATALAAAGHEHDKERRQDPESRREFRVMPLYPATSSDPSRD